jgi:hypothetical protein
VLAQLAEGYLLSSEKELAKRAVKRLLEAEPKAREHIPKKLLRLLE